MKLRISLLLAVALLTGACQKRSRLSPTVLTPPTPEKPARVAQKPHAEPVAIVAKSPASSKSTASTTAYKSTPPVFVSGPSYAGSAPLSPYPVTAPVAAATAAAAVAPAHTSAKPTASLASPKPTAPKSVRLKSPGSSTVVSSKPAQAEEKVRAESQLEKKKALAATRRSETRFLAEASLEAGRQLLREEQHESALKAFREAVRLNSNSAEAWMGIAYVSERNGNMKTAVEAFKEAKKLWGM